MSAWDPADWMGIPPPLPKKKAMGLVRQVFTVKTDGGALVCALSELGPRQVALQWSGDYVSRETSEKVRARLVTVMTAMGLSEHVVYQFNQQPRWGKA